MISERLKRTILNELKLKDFQFTDGITASEIPGWDSLNHINVILAIEKEYKIRFKNVEILRLKDISGLQELINSKAGSE
jgi:acyl carrier protein